MTYQTPCRQPENDSNDWFLSKDGKQYPDEPLIENLESFVADAIANGDERPEEKIIATATQDALKDALRRRRHAREKCHECYFRMDCLDKALRGDEMHGTWGGYYEEELREIRKEIARRKRVRRAE